MQREFVRVSKDVKGHVIGKDGCMIEDIRRQSGATVRSSIRDEEGFTVSGNAEQVACAKRLILRKVEEVKEEIWELVDIPDGYKGRVIGKGGANLREISRQTGAEVTRKRGGEVHIIRGTEEQREQAKMIIRIKVAYARLGGIENEFNKVCCFVDRWNLPEKCGLKLEQLEEEDRMVLPGTDAQYRLKPAKEDDFQEFHITDTDPSYLDDLTSVTLESLQKLKRESEANEHLEADMWCHFGTAIIRGPNEEEASDREWDSNEVTKKFQSSAERNYWRVAFREGVDLVEDILKENYQENTPEEYTEYDTRYDFTFLSPCCHQIKCKVWVTKEVTKKKLEDIQIPFSDVKNILEDIHFEDELTRSRCRGWLIYPSRRYLQADILFPGCEFDCRFTIRGRTESAVAADYVPKEEVTRVLLEYLSGLTLKKEDEFGIRLPEAIPKGFYLVHKRSSKRTMYKTSPRFNIILSKESSWRSVKPKERSRKTTDLHLHCEEWDKLLSNGQWEPDVIIRTLPEFLQFVKEVQSIVVQRMQQNRPTRRIPPEIFARGPLALEAYNNALAEGERCVKRVPFMMIGQARSGKTSLKKSLRGIRFNPEEDSTVGIDVDQYDFKVTNEIWETGKKDEEENSVTEAISFEHNIARFVVERLRVKENVTDRRRGTVDSGGSFDSEDTGVLMETQLSESSEDPQPIETSGDFILNDVSLEPEIPAEDIPDPTELSAEGDTLVRTQIPEFDEIAAITEKLLQDNWDGDETHVYSILWDFAGQSVYYTTHPVFLTARAIYFLVYDLSLNPHDRAKPLVKQGMFKEIEDSFNLKTNFDYLHFWMTSVASLPSQHEQPKTEVLPEKLPAVFLVCTHSDKPHDDQDPRKLAREIFGSLKAKPYGAHLLDVFCVDNTKSGSESECQDVMQLRKDVLAVANELPHLKESIPIKWLKYEKALQAIKADGYKWISLEKATHIASKICNIDKENEIMTMLDFLHDLRILIHFDDTPELNNVVVLDPQWLIDVFKKVITVRPYHRTEKNFLNLWCKLEKEGILVTKLLKHVWNPFICQKAPFESLLAIMEKFSLLCLWPSLDDSGDEQYLVPSMLKSHPPQSVCDLIASSRFPSLFLKFETGQVPAGLFPRFVLEFYQWCTCKFPKQADPQLFNNFARFFVLPEAGHSVVLLGHSLSIEILVLDGRKSLGTPDVTWARAVRNQVAFMINCMRNKFFWVKNVGCEISLLCPVCCKGLSVNYCRNHHVKACKLEECLHFFSESELNDAVCTRSATAPDIRVSPEHFVPWLSSQFEKDLSDLTVTDTSQGELAPGKPGRADTVLTVTLLASEWSSSFGGLSTINRQLAIFLAKQDQVEVTLLVPQFACSEEGKRTARSHNVAIREAERRPGYEPLDWLSFPPSDLAIDIVIGHGAKLGKQAQVIRKYHNCKWVQVVHTVPEELGMHKDYPKAISKGEEKNRTEVDLCKLANLVVAVGPKLAEAYSSYLRSCKERQDIIQLTPGTFSEFSDVKQATNENGKFKVLTFGRGDPEDFTLKGYDIAAKAIVELNDRSYRLIFVGAPDGKHDEVAGNLMKSGISKEQLAVRTFVTSKGRLKELFCEADVAIMPSRIEGFGLTALEALSAGLPILVSGNSGFGDALRSLPLGKSLVVDSAEPKDWAKAIRAVRLKDRAERLEEVQRLRTYYGEEYSWEKQCENLVEKMWSLVHD